MIRHDSVYLYAIEHTTFEREAYAYATIHYSGICITVVAPAVNVAAAHAIAYTVINVMQKQNGCIILQYNTASNNVQLLHLGVPVTVPVTAAVAL
jgi:hypothetical protein